MFPFSRETTVKWIIKALIGLGVAGGGFVGGWYGKTWVFEPWPEPPEILGYQLQTLAPFGKNSPVVILDVDLDRIGHISATVSPQKGDDLELASPKVGANSWRFILTDPRRCYRWGTLAEGKVPGWIKEIRIKTWSESLPTDITDLTIEEK